MASQTNQKTMPASRSTAEHLNGATHSYNTPPLVMARGYHLWPVRCFDLVSCWIMVDRQGSMSVGRREHLKEFSSAARDTHPPPFLAVSDVFKVSPLFLFFWFWTMGCWAEKGQGWVLDLDLGSLCSLICLI